MTVQDCTLRGNKVYLHVIHHRCIDKDTGQLVQRNWNLVVRGNYSYDSRVGRLLKTISPYLELWLPNLQIFIYWIRKKLKRRYKDHLIQVREWKKKNTLSFILTISLHLSLGETVYPRESSIPSTLIRELKKSKVL